MGASFVFTHFEKNADYGIANSGCPPAVKIFYACQNLSTAEMRET